MTEEASGRRQIIEVVNTPIAYLTLVLLIVDVTLCTLAVTLETERFYLVPIIVASLLLLSAVVVALAILRPEALRGDRPLSAHHAHQFASDLHNVLDGYLEPTQKAEAWPALNDVLLSGPLEDTAYRRFVERFSARIAVLALMSQSKRSQSSVLATQVPDVDAAPEQSEENGTIS